MKTATPRIRSFWEKIETLPPIACRILARVPKSKGGGVRLMTDQEIATRSGMDLSTVKSLSWKTTWSDVPLRQVRTFSEACGVHFDNRRNWQKQMGQLKRTSNSRYLRKSNDWNEIEEKLLLWKQST